MLRKSFTVYIAVLITVLSACSTDQVTTDDVITSTTAQVSTEAPSELLLNVFDIGPSDTFALSLYTTSGVYNIIDLDNDTIYQMLQDIEIGQSIDYQMEPGTTAGGRVIVYDSNQEKAKFYLTATRFGVGDDFNELSRANEMANFIMETRIILDEYLKLYDYDLEPTGESIKYETLFKDTVANHQMVEDFLDELYTSSESDIDALDQYIQASFDYHTDSTKSEEEAIGEVPDEIYLPYRDYLYRIYSPYMTDSIFDKLIANRQLDQVTYMDTYNNFDISLKSKEIVYSEGMGQYNCKVTLELANLISKEIHTTTINAGIRLEDGQIAGCMIDKVPVPITQK